MDFTFSQESIYNKKIGAMSNKSKQVRKIIKQKSFSKPQFWNHSDRMQQFIQDVNEMEINEDLFKIMRILMKFFRLPILILFRPIYQRIDSQQELYLTQNQLDLQKTAACARMYIKQRAFPCLNFYFKAGESSVQPGQYKQDDNPNFINFVQAIDEKIQDVCRGKSNSQVSTLKNLQNQVKAKIEKNQFVIQKMCLAAYLRIIKTRYEQLTKQTILEKHLARSLPFQRPKSTKILVRIGTNQQKQIEDPQAATDYLCCRSYFYRNQIIQQPQTLTQEYKNYQYPYDQYHGEILTKTICGFLNCKGGIIYIGIKQDYNTKKRTVFGYRYPESIKEKLLTYFRLKCQKIQPEIVNFQFYKIQFVPIKDHYNNWEPGMFILRIKVQRGNPTDLYSFKAENGEDTFAFRTQNQVLTQKIGQKTLELYRQRLLNPDKDPNTYMKHPGPCRPVELGKQVFQKESVYINPWDKKNSNSNGKSMYSQRKDSNPVSRDVEGLKRPFFICPKSDLIRGFDSIAIFFDNDWAMLKPKDHREYEGILKEIQKSGRIDSYKIASKIMKIEKEIIKRADKCLNEANILFANNYGQYELTFNSEKDVIDSVILMEKHNIPYDFQLSQKY